MIEHRWRLDVRMFRRRGWLADGMGGVLRRLEDGEETGSLSYRIDADAMVLSYTVRDESNQRVPVEVTVQVTRSACRFGGYRNYWLCPRCSRRCEILASGGCGGFACRRCLGLRYACEGQTSAYRLRSRANKLFGRLGGDDEFLRKPKWMRWPTFNRLAEQAQAFDAAATVLWLRRVRRSGMLSDELAASIAEL